MACVSCHKNRVSDPPFCKYCGDVFRLMYNAKHAYWRQMRNKKKSTASAPGRSLVGRPRVAQPSRQALNSRELYWRRRNDGLCVRCGNTALKDQSRCGKHLQEGIKKSYYKPADKSARAKYMREYYASRKKKGICVRCQNKATAGMTLCAKHLTARKVKSPRHLRLVA